MKTYSTLLFLLATLLFATEFSQAQDVIKFDGDDTTSLADRLSWASGQAAAGNWVAYSIERKMHEHSSMGSWSSRSTRSTFSELLYGIKLERRNGKWNKNMPNRTVVKEVVMLYLFDNRGGIEDVKFSTLDGEADLDGKDLIFLGMIDRRESLKFVTDRFEKATEDVREEFVAAIAMHDSQEAATLLVDILEDDASSQVREQAAFWMSQVSNTDATLRILVNAVENDPSGDVREQAVFAISQIDNANSTEALITLARKGPSDTKDEAIFWLGQKASDEATKYLSDLVDDDPDVDIKKQAVFALSQQEHPDGVRRLVDIARNHENAAVRKEAIFWLSQSDDPAALDAIIELARG